VSLEIGSGAEGHPLAGALIAEAARLAEAERASSAASGVLEKNELKKALGGRITLRTESEEVGIGGLGMGQGYGAGAGGLAVRSGRAVVRGARRWIDGERARVLWAVVDTGVGGNAAVELARPARPARWRLVARALSVGALGEATASVDTAARPFLALDPVAPAGPDDVVERAVRVVNPTEAALDATLDIDGAKTPLSVPAGEVRTVALGSQRAGHPIRIALYGKGAPAKGAAPLARAEALFPLAGGAPSPDGRVLMVAVGPGGGPPLSAFALEPDPGFGSSAARAAVSGRAALAALPFAEGSELEPLMARARDALALVRLLPPPDALRERAEVVRFLAEAEEPLHLTRIEVERAAETIRGAGGEAEGRVAAIMALARARVKVDGVVVERLLREAPELEPESAALFAQALHLLGRPAAAAKALVKGSGPEAVLAAKALGLPRLGLSVSSLAALAPAAGRLGRADWIGALAAVAPRGGRGAGQFRVTYDGRTLGSASFGPTTGARIRVALPSNASGAFGALSIIGAPGAIAIQERGFGGGAVDLGVVRVPAGSDGQPVESAEAALSALGRDGAHRPRACSPCALEVGDALAVDADLRAPGWAAPAGLMVEADPKSGRRWLRATAPGRYELGGLTALDAEGRRGLARPLVVEVAARGSLPREPGALAEKVAVALARQAAAAGDDPNGWLAARSRDQDWLPELLPEVATLRFQQAVKGAPEGALVTAFEDLRTAAPSANLGFSEVASVARAYRRAGRAERAVEVWRAGLEAAFLSEAAAIRKLEDVAGLLASLREMRRLIDRHPEGARSTEASFHLPERLASLADSVLPSEVRAAKIAPTDLLLMAAAWDREFLALYPDSPRAPEAGFHLVQGLLRLRAFAQAASWASQLAERHPRSPFVDSLLYAAGLARSELGDDKGALALFERVATAEFTAADGTLGPSANRADARYASARLHEARDQLEPAKVAYREVAGSAGSPRVQEEARRALLALETVRLSAEPRVLVEVGAPARLPLRASNLDQVHLRAYRLDLRTIFLRDGGLSGVAETHVAGVSPCWSGAHTLDAGPFEGRFSIELPLPEPGAYLVQVDGGGERTVSLVVRSGLGLRSEDDGQVRRVAVRRPAGPAAGLELRAIGADGEVIAAKTDLRGVAQLPSGAAVLVFDDQHYAFTEEAAPAAQGKVPPPAAPRPGAARPDRPEKSEPSEEGDLYENLNQRLLEQRSRNQAEYEQHLQKESTERIEAQQL
jgi:tetratricopeptide (TPR) repeat protein